jgi:hypothetical protein
MLQDIMNNFVEDMFGRIAGEAARLLRLNKKETLTAREVHALPCCPQLHAFPGVCVGHTLRLGRGSSLVSNKGPARWLWCSCVGSAVLHAQMQTAVRLLMEGQLANHAVNEGAKAVNAALT